MNIAELIAALTLEEKASLCSGRDFWTTKAVERLGIPSLMMTDGPHGLRKQIAQGDQVSLNQSVPATCFPSGAALASTWNRELVREVGQALGAEARAQDVAIVLGPAVNIKRSPLCGRNFEYLSEDPYLAGEIAVEHIQGVQSQGVGTSIKHFAANNQETCRMTVDAQVDERTLREIYLPAFEKAVKEAQPATVMCSYNRLNGVYASENPWLLTQVLRKEWGFQGFVVTDWGACNDRVEGLKAGQDLEMPSSGGMNDAKIVQAVREGRLDEAVLDRAVARILQTLLPLENHPSSPAPMDAEAHHALAVRTAEEASVLLKNEGNLLPLESPSRIAFIGALAEHPRYQGGGSSHICPTRLDSAIDQAQSLVQEQTADARVITYAPGYSLKDDSTSDELLAQAREAARQADTAVVFVGLTDRFESEGFDRQHLDLPESHNRLVTEVLQANPRTVVVLCNGAPVTLPWLADVPAVLESYLGGQGWGTAVVRVLLGQAEPGGRLAETFPLKIEDTPAWLDFARDPRTAVYSEGIFVGYRYYEARKQPVLFPFGHGLSYTQFAYKDLELSTSDLTAGDGLTVRLTVTNTGRRPGSEVVQLYVGDEEASVPRPGKELRKFTKIRLQPGESKRIEFQLENRDFAFWHPRTGGWTVESGVFRIEIGASSADLRLSTRLNLKAPVIVEEPWNLNSKLGDLLTNPKAGPRLQKIAEPFTRNLGTYEPGSPEALMTEAMVRELPLRLLPAFSGGRLITEDGLKELLKELNG